MDFEVVTMIIFWMKQEHGAFRILDKYNNNNDFCQRKKEGNKIKTGNSDIINLHYIWVYLYSISTRYNEIRHV